MYQTRFIKIQKPIQERAAYYNLPFWFKDGSSHTYLTDRVKDRPMVWSTQPLDGGPRGT